MGNWLTAEQARSLWQSSGTAGTKGKRDRALLALLLACGLSRHEAINLRVEHLQQREEHWAIVDLVGKAGHIRTVPMPDWVHLELVAWLSSASIDRGKVFRRVSRTGRVFGDGISEKVIWHVVRSSASKAGIPALAPHDSRRTCARLCRSAGGELDQIQLLLGHVSIQTTERYLGSQQRIRSAINDRIGIGPIVTTVHFGVLSMTRNRPCLSEESYFSPENHQCALSAEDERQVRELFENHFRRKDRAEPTP